MATLFPFPSFKAPVRAMSPDNWAKVTGGKEASMVLKLETTSYLALLFHLSQRCFCQCTIFPQDWSEDLLTVPLGVLSSGPRFLGKGERERALGVGRRVTGLRTSQGDIGRSGFSISTT